MRKALRKYGEEEGQHRWKFYYLHGLRKQIYWYRTCYKNLIINYGICILGIKPRYSSPEDR